MTGDRPSHPVGRHRAASNGEGADVDTLAEILAPFAFKSWRGMVDHCLKSGDDQQTSEFYATETYGGQMEQARVDAKKAIDYFAALAASSHPASAGDALADELRRAFPVGDKIGVRLSEDMFSRILRALSATPAQEVDETERLPEVIDFPGVGIVPEMNRAALSAPDKGKGVSDG